MRIEATDGFVHEACDDGRVEDDRVLREGVELGGRLPRVAVDAGVVGPQGVHEVDDRRGGALRSTVTAGRSPPGALRLARLLVAARLEHQLAPLPGVLREVHVHRDPRAVLGVGRSGRGAASRRCPRGRLRFTLTTNSTPGRSWKRGSMAQASCRRAPFGTSSAKRSRPGRPGGEAAVEDVVQAEAALRRSRGPPRGPRRRHWPRRGGRRRRGGPRARGGRPQAGEGEGGGERRGEDRSHRTNRRS